MKKLGLFAILIVLFSAINFAQGLSIGPELGYYKADDAEDGEFMFGAQARLRFSETFAVEGAIDYRKEEYYDGAVEVASYPVQATALIYPLPIAYGAIGLGWYNTSVTYNTLLGEEEETSQEFGYHFGGGVEFPLNRNLSISGDIRYVFLDYEFEEIPFEDVDSNFFVIKAALLIKL